MDDFESHVEFVGPFRRWAVVVDGWEVPFLDAHPQAGGRVSLGLDGRYGLDLSVDEAERVIPFIAHAVALGAGFAGHPSGSGEPRPLGHARPRRLRSLDIDDQAEGASPPAS